LDTAEARSTGATTRRRRAGIHAVGRKTPQSRGHVVRHANGRGPGAPRAAGMASARLIPAGAPRWPPRSSWRPGSPSAHACR